MIKRLYTFNILNFRVDGGAMFGVVPKVIWSRHIPSDHNNNIPLALRSLVVETENRLILIDTGIGNKQGKRFMDQLQPFGGSGIIGGLEEGGYRPEDITDVILTHLHFDHCGGSLRKNESGEIVPAFPNAQFHISATQWNNAKNPNIREADAILPENIFPLEQAGVLNLIEGEGDLVPGVFLKIADGHTPGQLIPIIRFNNKYLIYGADLFPTRVHVPLKYNMAYDLEVTKTMDEKISFLQQYGGAPHAILFEHDIEIECGITELTSKGYRIARTLRLEEWITEP